MRGGRAGRKHPCRAVVLNHLNHAGFIGAKRHLGHSQQSYMGTVFPLQELGFAFVVSYPCTLMLQAGRGRMEAASPSKEERAGWVQAAGSRKASAFVEHSSCAKHFANIIKAQCSSLSPS